MKIIDAIKNNGFTEKWESGKYSLAIQVMDDGPFDAVVCAGPGLNANRIKFKGIDISAEISDDEVTLIHMIPTRIWESMKENNALNEDKE